MRFNRPAEHGSRIRTVNLAGGSAYKQTARQELVSAILTTFLTDSYYETAQSRMQRLEQLVQADPLFAAQAAIYARHVYGMRSVTHLIAGIIGENVKGQKWTKHFFANVIRRPDDILEILSYIRRPASNTANKAPIPNSMKKGFALALQRFDAYQLGKYKREGAAMTLVDAVNLVRPVPTPQLDQLMKGTLPLPETWEVMLTQAGDDKEKKANVWRTLLNTGRLGYFALLRNLWNISQHAPDALPSALAQLVEPSAIRRSLVFPFRFLVAIKEMQNKPSNTNLIIGTLSKALDLSVDNIPSMHGKTLVIVDRSGSMSNAVTMNTSLSCAELGCLFGLAFARKNEADVMIFGDTAAMLSYNPHDSLASLTQWAANEINQGSYYYSKNKDQYDVGHSTNLSSAIQLAQLHHEKHGTVYDRFIILSDMQSWLGSASTALAHYEKATGKRPFIHSFDLRGYGSLEFPEDRTLLLSGFSEKVFDLIRAVEAGTTSLVETIALTDIMEGIPHISPRD